MTIAEASPSSIPAGRIRVRAAGAGRRAARSAVARRRREEEAVVEALRAEADAAARARPEVLSLLSHDLRNPLGVVLMSLHPLGRAVPPDHPARRHYDMLKRAALELGQMLDTTSEAVRVERGSVSLASAEEDASALIATAIEATRRRADERGLKLQIDVPAGLPKVNVSAEKIGRALTDLLARAVRVAPKNSTVAVHAQPDEEGVRISIADRGSPIPEAFADQVFDVPQSAAHRHASNAYFVLDLFVARGVIEAHGGRVWLEPTPGGGTTFVLTLPS
jgi:signal transduction histidine kinase